MWMLVDMKYYFFFQAEDGIRDIGVTGVQTCALPILPSALSGLMYGKELVSKIARYPKIGVYMKGTGKEILSFINIKFFFISIVVYVLGIGAYYAFMKYSKIGRAHV